MKILKRVLSICILFTALFVGAVAVGAIDLANKEFFFLPVTPPQSELPDVVKNAEGEVVPAPTGDELEVLEIPYDGRLLFRFVHQKITGEVLFLSIFSGEDIIYANEFAQNIGYITDDTVLPFARFVDIDINGNERKDIVLESYTGGAHCCTTTLFFEYDEEGVLEFKGKLPSMHSKLNFTNLDSDPAYEIEVVDSTFAYWNAPYSRSAKPRIVLDFNGEWYEPSERIMVSGIDEDVLKKKAEYIRLDEEAWDDATVHYDLMKVAIEDIIYAGNGPMLNDFLERAWPEKQADRRKWFISELQPQIQKSPWWNTIASINGWSKDYPLFRPEVIAEEMGTPEEEAKKQTQAVLEKKDSPLVQGPEKQPIPETQDNWVEQELKEEQPVRTYFEF